MGVGRHAPSRPLMPLHITNHLPNDNSHPHSIHPLKHPNSKNEKKIKTLYSLGHSGLGRCLKEKDIFITWGKKNSTKEGR